MTKKEAVAGLKVLEKFVSENPNTELEKMVLEMFSRAVTHARDFQTCFNCVHWERSAAPEQMIGNCNSEEMQKRKDYRDRRSWESTCSEFKERDSEAGE